MKIILAVLVFVTICTSAVAQFSFGVKSGLNVNNMLLKYDDPQQKDWSSTGYGFHFGMYSKIPLSKKMLITTEIQYSRRGDRDLKIGYLELPVLFSYSVLKSLEVQLGVNGALKLPHDDLLIDSYNALDFGLTGGLNFLISEKISLTGRYYYGLPSVKTVDLSKVYTCTNCDPLLNPPSQIQNEYNRSIQLSISYKIK
jgi:hypothetical protein